jgi:hypothetical protein
MSGLRCAALFLALVYVDATVYGTISDIPGVPPTSRLNNLMRNCNHNIREEIHSLRIIDFSSFIPGQKTLNLRGGFDIFGCFTGSSGGKKHAILDLEVFFNTSDSIYQNYTPGIIGSTEWLGSWTANKVDIILLLFFFASLVLAQYNSNCILT